MCGFVGFIEYGQMKGDLESLVHSMNQTLSHRGPDGEGTFVSHPLAFGHRRLSIVDLSEAGKQPMTSSDGRFTINYNGEIYNHIELRKSLTSPLRGSSDTEVLVESIAQNGLEQSLKEVKGMFAFSLFDKKENTLTLVRDRAGEKPLYYGVINQTLFFGSELKAFVPHPAFEKEIDQKALSLFFQYNCIPAPFSIFKGIKKLRPGHTITFQLNQIHREQQKPYWTLQESIREGKKSPLSNFDEAQSVFEATMDQVLSEQMEMDVPYGAFLSGGIDSSLIVSLMQKRSSSPIKTFTIGFDQKEYNEAEHAREVAAHLRTEHTELYLKGSDCLNVIPNLPTIYDEPFSDSSQIPTWLVSNMTRNHVTVALTGDGGDEVFGGYNRHFLVPQIQEKTKHLPQKLKQILGGSLKEFSPQGWNRLGKSLGLGHSAFGDKIYKMADVLEADSLDEIYQKLTTHWEHPPLMKIPERDQQVFDLGLTNTSEILMAQDFLTYLPNDILTKVDRAGMSVSLETRIPFLDQRVIDFSWRLPIEHKVKGNQGKYILRETLKKYIPEELYSRPKTGFGVPLDSWLRTDLRDWAESLLSQKKLAHDGLLSYPEIKQKWDAHQNGTENNQYLLWDVLMFQAWRENF